LILEHKEKALQCKAFLISYRCKTNQKLLNKSANAYRNAIKIAARAIVWQPPVRIQLFQSESCTFFVINPKISEIDHVPSNAMCKMQPKEAIIGKCIKSPTVETNAVMTDAIVRVFNKVLY